MTGASICDLEFMSSHSRCPVPTHQNGCALIRIRPPTSVVFRHVGETTSPFRKVGVIIWLALLFQSCQVPNYSA